MKINSTFKTLSTICYRIGMAILYPFIKICQPLKRKFRPIRRRLRHKKRRLLAISLIAISILVPLIYFVAKPKPVAAWWDEMWLYRRELAISMSSGESVSDYQIDVVIATDSLIAAGKMQEDCGDIRFTSAAGVALPYWIEESGDDACNDSGTRVWVKVDSVPQDGTDIYLYYGNPSADDGQRPDETFLFFDDFSSGTFANWAGDTGSYSISNGVLSSSVTNVSIHSRIELTDVKVKARLRGTDASTAKGSILIRDDTQGGAPHGGGRNAYVLNTRVNAEDDLRLIEVNSGTPTTLNTDTYAFATNTWYTALFRASTSNLDAFMSVAANVGATDSTHTYGYVGLGQPANAGFEWDWFMVGKYALNGPSTGSPGPEEKGPGPIAYWSFDEGYGTTIHNQMEKNGEDGLVGWWKMDEGADNTCSNGTDDVCDTMTTNDAVRDGATWTTSGKIGNALSFDNVDDVVDAGSDASLDDIDKITITAWIKPIGWGEDPTYGYGRIAHKSSTNGWVFYLTNNESGHNATLKFYRYHATQNGIWFAETNSIITLSTWQHVAVTYDKTSNSYDPIFYVNGVAYGAYEELTPQGGASSEAAANFLIGNHPGKDRTFNGTIDHVKVYNRILTQAEIQAEYNSEHGHMIDMDASTDWVEGAQQNPNQTPMGKALDFDGSNDKAVLPETIDLAENSPWSISYWFWQNAGTNDDITLGDGTDDYNLFEHDTNGTRLQIIPNAATSVDLTFPYDTRGSWHHAMVTCDGSATATFKLYLDGEEVDSDTNATSQFKLNTFGQGETAVGTYFWTGKLDEAKVYDYDLTADQVKKQYNRDAGAVLGAGEQANKGAGPEGFWKFDEGSGYTAFDFSENEYRGKLTNMSSFDWVPGKIGKALDFDNTNDYVDMGDVLDFDYNDPFTLEAWIKTDTTELDMIIAKMDNAGPYRGYDIFVDATNNGEIVFQLISDWAAENRIHLTGTKAVNDGEWHHIALTYDGSYAASGVTLYIDGSIDTLNTAYDTLGTNTTVNSDPLRIGSRSNSGGSYFFDGLIDHVKIYDYERSASQVHQDMDGSPMGHWSFDEGRGTTVHDQMEENGEYGLISWWKFDDASSGQSPAPQDEMAINDGTWTANASYTSTAKIGNAATFDGTGDFVSVTDDPSISVTGPLTVSLWARFTSAGTVETALGKWGNPNSSYVLWKDASNKANFSISSDGAAVTTVTGTSTLSINTWYHLVGVYEWRTSLKIYVDGDLENTNTTSIPSSIHDGSTALTIGRNAADATQDWPGQLDQVKIFGRAFSAGDVKTEYDSTHGHMMYMDASTDWVGGAQQNSNQTPMGKALDFDGSNDYVTVGDKDELDGLSTITVSTWVNFSSLGTRQSLISKAYDFCSQINYSVSSYSLAFNSDNDKIYWDVFTCNTAGCREALLTNKTDWQTGRWYHIVGTWEEGSPGVQKIYVDGVLDNSSAPDGIGMNATTTPLVFGMNAKELTFHLNGKLDEAKIYNYVLTADEVKVQYNRGKAMVLGAGINDSDPGTDNLVGHWKLDEAAGFAALDSSGNGNDGELTNMTVKEDRSDWVPGKIGKALDFDGSNDYVNFGSDSSLRFTTQPFTLEAWIYPTATSAEEIIASDDTTNGYGFVIASGKLRLVTRGTTDASTDSNSTIYTNQWTHVVAVFTGTGGERRLYINGVEDATESFTGSVTIADDPVYIGARPNGSNYFNGQIDNVKIFNTDLTDGQIAWEYSQGKPIAHWRFDEKGGYIAGNAAQRTLSTDGLVAFWRMESATSNPDYSGNGWTGTVTGSPSTCTGKKENCVDFETTAQYMSVASPYIDLDQQYTLMAWFKWPLDSTPATWNTLFRGNGGDHQIIVQKSDNHLGLYDAVGGGGFLDTGFDMDNLSNGWHHIANSAGNFSTRSTFYIDGEVVGNRPIKSTDNVRWIGNYSSNQNWGEVDHVKIYDRWLSGDEIKAEIASNENYGYLNNMYPPSDWVTGKRNGALDFDGSNDYVKAASPDFKNQNFSLTAWVKTQDTAGAIITFTNTTGYYGWSFRTVTDGYTSIILLSNVGGTLASLDSLDSITDDNWHYVAVTDDGTNLKSYVDGKLSNSGASATKVWDTTMHSYLGYWRPEHGSPLIPFDGTIDEAKVYNYALTADQIKVDYNNGAVIFR